MDLATIGYAVDTSGLARGEAALDSFQKANEDVAASAGRAQAAVSRTATGLGAVAPAAQGAAKATAFAAYEVTNLTRQIADVGVSLASGASPFMVMMQQGAQISDVMGQRGVRGALAGVAQGITALISPTTIALGAITVAGYAISAIWDGLSEDVRDVDDVLKDHAKTIRDIKGAYEDAMKGLDAYAAASSKLTLGVRSRAGLAENQVMMRSTAESMADQFRGIIAPNPNAIAIPGLTKLPELLGLSQGSEFAGFNKAIDEFFTGLRSGKSDVDRLVASIVQIADADQANAELQKTAASLLSLIEPLRQLQDQAKALREYQKFTSKEAVDRRRNEAYQQYRDSRMAPEAQTAQWKLDRGITTIPVPGANPNKDLGTDINGSVEGIRAAQETLRGAQNALSNAGLSSYARGLAEINQRYDELILKEREAGRTGAEGILNAARAAELAAAARQVQTAWAEMTDEYARSTDIMREETNMIGQSTGVVETYRAAIELLTAAKKNDGIVTEQELEVAKRLSAQRGEEAQRAEDQRKAYSRLTSQMDDLRGTTSSVISGLIKGQDVTQMLTDKLIDFSSKSLTDALLGPSGKPGGGLFGDALAGLLGGGPGAMSVATAQITAATVVINGGVAGGVPAGLPGAVANGLAPGSPGGAYAPTGSSAEIAARVLREREGFRENAYWDVDHWRVGYGSDTVTDPATGAVSTTTAGSTVSRAAAEADLARRIATQQQGIIGQVGSDAWGRLNPGTQGALTSVAYNYGSLPGRVVPAVQGGDPNAISGAIEGLAGDNGGVNASRRMLEAAMVRESQAIGQLGQAASTATTSVGDFGGGVASVASALTGGGGGAPAAGASGGGGLLGAIFSGIGGLFSGGFATGGYIPPGRWGVVGERGPEPAFGGRTGMTVTPNMGGGGGAVVNINDYRSGGERPQVHSRRGPRGEEVLEVMIRDGVGQETREGGSIDRSMVSRGLDVPITRRA